MEEPTRLPPIKLSDEAWDRFKVLAGAEVRDNNGRNFRQRLEHMMSSLIYQKQSDWPDGGKAMMIANIHHEFKDRALIQLRREYLDVDQALKAHEMEEISRKVPITNPRATPRPEPQNLWQRALPGLFR